MRDLAVFRALPDEDRRLLFEAFVATVMFRLALYFFSIERLRRLAGRRGHGTRPVDRIVWAARAAARRVPGTTCLSSALALQRLLTANAQASELHIGVTRDGGKFEAHAWVEQEGRILIGEDERRAYTRLLSWRAAAGPPSLGADRTHPG